MAKIVETVFVVKISKLAKDNDTSTNKTGFEDLPATLEEVVSGLVSNDCIVEVEQCE